MLEKKEGEVIRSFGNIIAWSTFLAFDLIILGSLVRATDSGLACPDWPLCYNQLAPAMDMQIFLEWFHRLSALILGGVLLLAIVKIFRHSIIRKHFGSQLYFVGFLFLTQCVLGGLTVLKLLDPTIVSLHLLNALIFFALLFWVAIKAWLLIREMPLNLKLPNYAKHIFLVFAGLTLSQILLGGMVASNHAGLVCPDFPKCHGQWLPQGSFLIYLQQFHRFAAFLILAYSIAINFIFFRSTSNSIFNFTVRIIPTLVLFQGLLGLVNVYYGTPVWASVAHLANALILFTISFGTAVILWSSKSFDSTFQQIDDSKKSMAESATTLRPV